MPTPKNKPSVMQRMWRRVAMRALKYAGIPLRDPALVTLFGRQDNYSGIDVDEDTALNFSAVWSAINLVSSSTAFLPCNVYSRDKTAQNPEVTDHRLHMLLNVSPNPHMTAFNWRETMQAYLMTNGNCYSYIERDGKGPDAPPIALWPIPPSQMRPVVDEETNELYYERHGGIAGDALYKEVYEPWELLHIAGLGNDGIQGYGVIQRAREAIGLSGATEKYGAAFFGEGATPRIAVTHPEPLSDKARRNFRQSWKDIYGNRDNPHNVALLDEGMTVNTISLSPEDSQFLSTRQFQVVEIARWFRVPPIMLYSMEGATFNNTEQMNLHFLQFTLYPWLIRWVQELSRKLLTLADHKMYYLDFDVAYLLMADMATRYSAYATGRNGGWLTLNHIARRERLPLLDSKYGDRHIKPSTMVNLEADDPTTPIPMETITALIEQLKSMGGSGVSRSPLPEATARAIIVAAVPSATPDFISQIIAFGKSNQFIMGATDAKVNAA